jgi:hypothetical protein
MPKNFLPVPDWFSAENQGGNIAVADLSHSGKQDLLVLAVDNPGGLNRGVYRIGRQLDDQGNVTGGWTPWIDIPDWFSFENQGAGAAIFDIDKDGNPDLIVFMMITPEQTRATTVWARNSPMASRRLGSVDPIPNWFSWENQHGTLPSKSRQRWQPRAHRVTTDNPPGQNRGIYQIGRKRCQRLSPAAGRLARWDGWFSRENQGVGAVLISHNGRNDLLVFRSITLSAEPNLLQDWSGVDVNGNVTAGSVAGCAGMVRLGESRRWDRGDGE